MKVKIAAVLTLLLVLGQPLSASTGEPEYDKGYWSQLGTYFMMGVKNVVSAPWEIPYSIRKHDQKDNGNPRVFRDAAGVVDGLFRTVTRFGSGVFDMAWAFIPGQQKGITLEPETFF